MSDGNWWFNVRIVKFLKHNANLISLDNGYGSRGFDLAGFVL